MNAKRGNKSHQRGLVPPGKVAPTTNSLLNCFGHWRRNECESGLRGFASICSALGVLFSPQLKPR